MEQKLQQGLKRWAEAGKPTLDLEGYVKQRLAQEQAEEQRAERVPVELAPVRELKPKSRRWTRWVAAAAMVAGVFVTANATFPMWAGAASSWPLVGPLVTEVIMQNVGLKWAYEAGLINESKAQVQFGEVTIKVLGIVADPSRTTVLYQVTGFDWDEYVSGAYPGREEMPHYPAVYISSVNGTGTGSSSVRVSGQTPLGFFGITTTVPLETEDAVLELSFSYGEHRASLEVPVSRKASSALSREVPVGKSVSSNGVTLTVESVIYTPVETVVKYHIEREPFYGFVTTQGRESGLRLIQNGQSISPSHGIGQGDGSYVNFPTIAGGGQLVMLEEVVSRDILLEWPLQEGASHEVFGGAAELVRAEQRGNQLNVEWLFTGDLGGIEGYEFTLSDGTDFVPDVQWRSTGAVEVTADGKVISRYGGIDVTLPDGAEVVAIRTKQAGVFVQGPWVIELPQK